MKSNVRTAQVMGGLVMLALASTATAQTGDTDSTSTGANETDKPTITAASKSNNTDSSLDDARPADDEVVVLQPFEVNSSSDVGYIAVDSLAGGRVNTPLKLTPASVSSLTSTFMEDLNLTNARDALKWTPNAVVESATAGSTLSSAFHDWSFNFRGAGAGEQGGPGPTRNYFSYFQNPDSYNVERMEFLRGPNSLIFGIGTVGGTLNIYTKRPVLDNNFTTIGASIDSNNGMRATVDTNVSLAKNLAVRFNAVADDFKGWVNNDNGHFRASDLSVQYKPFENTWITVDAEYGRRHRTLYGYTLGDEVSGWDGETASETWGAEPTGDSDNYQAIQNAGAWGDWMTSFPVLIDGEITYWAGGYASTTSLSDTSSTLNYQPVKGWYPSLIKKVGDTEYQSTEDIPVLDSEQWTYGNGVSDIEYKDFTLNIDQTVNENIDFTVGAYYYADDNVAQVYESTGGAAIDINKQLPDGSDNPHYGEAFADFYLSKQHQWRSVREMRAQVNYHFDATFLGSPMHQLFSASASYKEQKISARQYLGLDCPADEIEDVSDWSQDLVWGRIYLDNPNQRLEIPSSVYWEQDPAGYWYDFDDKFKLRDVALFSNTRLFDDALSIQAGVRYDSYSEHLVNQRANDDLSDEIIDEHDHGTTYSMGGIYYFHWIGAFVNFSENMQPPTAGMQSLLDGSRPGPEEGKGVEYGLRFSTNDNRYYASISRYSTESTDHAVENPLALRSIWSAYYDALPDLDRDTTLTNLAYSDTTDLDVDGWECEFTANPTKNIRLQASYSRPHTKIRNYYPMAKAYFESHLSEWEDAVANADSDDDAEALQDEIDEIQDDIDQAVDGAIETGMVRHTASFFAMYSFLDDDPLSGFSIGGGFTHQGKAYLATYDDVKYWSNAILTVNMVMSYKTTIFGKETRFGLNIDNLLNDKDPIITSYSSVYVDTNNRHIRDGYYIRDPRTFTLTATMTF